MKASQQKKHDVDIGAVVYLAYTDITATASRALFGLEARDRQYQTLKIPELDNASPACIHGPQAKVTKAGPPMVPVLVINCQYEEKHKPRMTMVIINTHVPNEKSHYVAKAIVDLCAERYVMKLVILSTQRLDIEQRSKLFENSFNGMAPVTQRPRLPEDILVTDAFLSNLIQLCTIGGQPFSVVTAPAHRCPSGQASAEDGSLQLIRLFQNTLIDSTGIMFSDKLSTSLMYRDSTDDAHATLMYA